MDFYDIASVWVFRPNGNGGPIFDILGVHVDRCIQANGTPDRWAIRSGEHYVLGKDRQWVLEPLPSSRDDAFYATYRFDTLEEAFAFACVG